VPSIQVIGTQNLPGARIIWTTLSLGQADKEREIRKEAREGFARWNIESILRRRIVS